MQHIPSSVPRGTGPLPALPTTPTVRSTPTSVSSPTQSKGSSQTVQKSTESTRQASQKLRELTGTEAVAELQGSLKGQTAHSMQKRSQALQSELSGTGLGKDLQKAEAQLSGLKQSYQKGMESVSDLQGTSGLLKGELNAHNLQSATRLGQRVGQISGSDLISKGTGKVLAPLQAVCSGKASLKACEKLWDDPNPENLKAAASQSITFLKDLKASIELLPGGKVLSQAIEKLLKNIVPGAGLAELGDQFLKTVDQIKLAIDKPTALNISNAVLEVVKTTASAGKLAGGIVGYASSAVYTGTELVQSLVNTDWKAVGASVSSSVSEIAKTTGSYLTGACRWLGWA